MQGFPPMNKYGLQTVMKLASCYGLKSSAQGSGKKQFVVVRPSAPSASRSGLHTSCSNLCTRFTIRIMARLPH